LGNAAAGLPAVAIAMKHVLSEMGPIRGTKALLKLNQKDGFDLDLSYITERIIAMGFPSEGSEGLYRNPIGDVVRLFDTKHEGKYKLYNLCSERSYNAAIFHGRVGMYPFDDHNCPEFKLIYEFCKDADEWLAKDEGNVIAVHCKAGKGRTGLMISCFLLYSNVCGNPRDALEFFGNQRTSNGKGVTIPSQKRYVEYFFRFLQSFRPNPMSFNFQGYPFVLTNVRITTVPRLSKDKGCDIYFEVRDIRGKSLYDSRKNFKPRHFKDEEFIDIPCVASVRGDIKVMFYNTEEFSRDALAFQFWVNTSFIEENYVKIVKNQIDKAIKDTEHKKYSEKFSVELYFRPDDLITADEIKNKVILNEEQILEQTFQKIKDSEQELADLIAQREQIEEDIEQAMEDNRMYKNEQESLRRNIDVQNEVKM
jgi:phosphatidylinositol-3,4,5-trisphosphate 3-phosphatase/dual-specificity protein phosphatase PTEN